MVITLTPEQLHRAGQDPDGGWPTYDVMYPARDSKKVIRGPIFSPGSYRNLDAKHGWVTGGPIEPLAKALNFAGAVLVDVTEFRTLDGNFGPERSPVNGDFQVRESRGRQARVGADCHEWRAGVRLGATASGEWSQRTYDLASTPPGIRKAGFREVTEALRYPRQVPNRASRRWHVSPPRCVRTVRRRLAHPRPVGRNLRAGTPGDEKVGCRPACQSVVLSALRPPNPYCSSRP